MMQGVFELRYQVYCLEQKFLPPERYPDGLEIDEHDDESAHFCAYNQRDELVGYVRLVRPAHDKLFPFERHCETLIGDATLPRPDQAAEISRLMVRSDYRRGPEALRSVKDDEAVPPVFGAVASESTRILLNLYREMYQYSVEHGIRHWYAAMERSLARSLVRANFAFRQIGPATDYFGPVAPYLADLQELESRVREVNPALLSWLRRPRPGSSLSEGSEPAARWRFTHLNGPALVRHHSRGIATPLNPAFRFRDKALAA